MQNNVFIVGNGFDLALKLPTSYSDFSHAEKFWPKTESDADVRKQWEYKRYKSLETYLEEKKDLEIGLIWSKSCIIMLGKKIKEVAPLLMQQTSIQVM